MWTTAEMSLIVQRLPYGFLHMLIWTTAETILRILSCELVNESRDVNLHWRGAPIIQQHRKTELHWSSENGIETGVKEIEMAARKESV